MLFLLRGKHGPLMRTILGAAMLIVGLLLNGWLLLAAVGAVLLVWGVITLITDHVSRSRHVPTDGSRQP